MVIAVVYMFTLNYQREKFLAKEVHYTVGEITEYKVGPKSRMFIYFFKVNSDSIEGHLSIDENFRKKFNYEMKEFEGKKFLVEYSIEKPKFNKIEIEKPIPNNLLDCDTCVWSEPPF